MNLMMKGGELAGDVESQPDIETFMVIQISTLCFKEKNFDIKLTYHKSYSLAYNSVIFSIFIGCAASTTL